MRRGALVIRTWKGKKRTIAVDGAVRAGLLAVALDFLPSTFIAGSSYPSPLLHGRSRLLRLVGVIIVDWRLLLSDICGIFKLSVILARLAGACGVDVNSVGGWRVHSGAQVTALSRVGQWLRRKRAQAFSLGESAARKASKGQEMRGGMSEWIGSVKSQH
jgi:hypothetical protein